MIKEFVDEWFARQDWVNTQLKTRPIRDYEDLVKIVAECVMFKEEDYLDQLYIKRTAFNDYSGVEYFIITTNTTADTDETYITHNWYGSCSGCDTLLGITHYEETGFDEQQIKDLNTLCLHLLQRMKPIYTEEELKDE